MKQLYVITASGGGSDDQWTRVAFVTDDKDKGDAYVEKMNAFREDVQSAMVQSQNWMLHYQKINPIPQPAAYEPLVVPKWGSKVKITEAMRAERDNIQAENVKLSVASLSPMREWRKQYEKALELYQSCTFTPEINNGMEMDYHDSYWDIDPVMWLE